MVFTGIVEEMGDVRNCRHPCCARLPPAKSRARAACNASCLAQRQLPCLLRRLPLTRERAAAGRS